MKAGPIPFADKTLEAYHCEQSSNLLTFDYDADQKMVIIEFKGGGKYIYMNVPQEIVDKFYESESKGKYFHQFIKGKFTFEKIELRLDEQIILALEALDKFFDSKQYLGSRIILASKKLETGEKVIVTMLKPYGVFEISLPSFEIRDCYEYFK